jgi:hypothetical protein
MLPGFVKFVRGQGASASGPSYGNAGSSRQRGHSTHTASETRNIPGEVDNRNYDCYFELGVINDAHVSAASLLEAGQKNDTELSIVKTVHIQTEYDGAGLD